ncbi:DUF445 family protein [Paraburkholderia mimosarum]|uniref:DUF445 family protein n=1 Tax=Paraburkholderia mimosarum TaxID=312026 RepID=UPI001FD3A734|nr:DUF445 family protein [Paraburkholderia mimosarum]
MAGKGANEARSRPHSALKRLIRVEIAQCERFSGSGRVNRGRPLPVEGYFRNLLGKSIGEDRAIQHKLNAWWLEVARDLVVRYRHQLSTLITDVVKSWKAEEVSRKIEVEIGRDLQFVRVNGTLVGGTVGVLLHALILVVAT